MRMKDLSRREFVVGASTLALGAIPVLRGHAHAAGRDKRLATFVCDVTPPLGTPIYSSYKPLETVEFPLLAKGIILEDGGPRYVLCAVDWCEICNSTHTQFRRRLAEATGADIAHVAVQTVHQHTAPMADADAANIIEASDNPPPHPAISVFEAAAESLAAAAAQAVEKLVPYDQIGLGQARVERVASNRRVPIEPGKVGFRASSCKDPKLIQAPEGLIDPFVKTITFRQGETPLARMHYYATHPQSFYGDPRASYDFTGMARENLEKSEGVFQIYFTGCSGDIAAGKYNDASPEAREGLAKRLLAGMASSVAATQYQPAPDLRWTTTPLLLKTRQDAGFTEAECRAEISDASKVFSVRNDAAMVLSFLARAREPIELSALHMGEVSIVHLPGEPVIDFQLYAQQLAPKGFVAVAGYGDCAPAYICLQRSFAEGGYEPTATHVVPESEVTFRAAIRALMES